MRVVRTIVLQHSDKPDFENQGRGIPNYLGAAAISPDGTQAWVPSKQDNVKRGTLRDGAALELPEHGARDQLAHRPRREHRGPAPRASTTTTRASPARRVYDPRGVYMFVALETSREVAVVDAHGALGAVPLRRRPRAAGPRGVAPTGSTLYVNNFMDRTVGVFDLAPLLQARRSAACRCSRR